MLVMTGGPPVAVMPPLTAEAALLLFLLPIFMVFELVQLVLAERLIGARQIERGIHPRETGPGEVVALLWSFGILCYWSWMGSLVVPEFTRVVGVCLLFISAIGLSLRRHFGLKKCLKILTFEGAFRLGFLVYLLGAAWRAR